MTALRFQDKKKMEESEEENPEKKSLLVEKLFQKIYRNRFLALVHDFHSGLLPSKRGCFSKMMEEKKKM